MLSKGRLAIKIAGRDTGVCVVLDKKEDKLQVFGPNVRKRWINAKHLEPLKKTLDEKDLSDEKKLLEKLNEFEEEWKNSVPDFLSQKALKARLGS